MSDDSQRNSAFNVAADSKVHHAQVKDFTKKFIRRLKKRGVHNGAGRTEAQTQQMLDKIPPSQRAGVDSKSAAAKVKEYLADKDASHVKPHSKGGSSHPDNIKWENETANKIRGDKPMTRQEQVRIDSKARIDNLTGAWKAGLEAASKGAVIGAVTTAPFSMLRNALRFLRGEISAEDAALESVKETAIGGGVGAATAFTVTTVATACPPVAIALTAISPVLLVAGGTGMVYEFFKILDDHKRQTKEYYEALTQHDLNYLKEVENELVYEHNKKMSFLKETQALNAEITNRPVKSGVEEALKRYLESAAIAKSLGAMPVGSKQLHITQNYLPTAT